MLVSGKSRKPRLSKRRKTGAEVSSLDQQSNDALYGVLNQVVNRGKSMETMFEEIRLYRAAKTLNGELW